MEVKVPGTWTGLVRNAEVGTHLAGAVPRDQLGTSRPFVEGGGEDGGGVESRESLGATRQKQPAADRV